MAIAARNKNDNLYWMALITVGFLSSILLIMDWNNYTTNEVISSIISILLESILPAYAMFKKTKELVNAIFGGTIAILGCFWLVYNCITVYSTSDVNLICILMSLVTIGCGGHFVHLTVDSILTSKKKQTLRPKTKKA